MTQPDGQPFFPERRLFSGPFRAEAVSLAGSFAFGAFFREGSAAVTREKRHAVPGMARFAAGSGAIFLFPGIPVYDL